MVCSFFCVSSLIFWLRWSRVLVTGKSSGPVGCSWRGLWSFGCLDLTWPPVQTKWAYRVCCSDCWEIYLDLWGVLQFRGRVDHGEDDEVGGVVGRVSLGEEDTVGGGSPANSRVSCLLGGWWWLHQTHNMMLQEYVICWIQNQANNIPIDICHFLLNRIFKIHSVVVKYTHIIISCSYWGILWMYHQNLIL